jgi:hypothetical protein
MHASKRVVLPVILLASFIDIALGGTTASAATTLPAGYQAMAACDKQALLWNDHISPSEYDTLPAVTGSWTTMASRINSLLFLNRTFDHNSDLMPQGRDKVVHAHGAAAAVELVVKDDSPFSGVFAPGTVCGIARISLAGSPSQLGFTPGMGVKLLVDGAPSINFHVMHSVNGQGDDHNVFAKTFTNDLPAARGFTLKALAFAIKLTGHDLTKLPIPKGAARLRADGTSESDPVAIKQIAFVPTLTDDFAGTTLDFRAQLASVPAGTVIYQVHGRVGSERLHFADLKTTSPFVASEFADRQLFFRHAE